MRKSRVRMGVPAKTVALLSTLALVNLAGTALTVQMTHSTTVAPLRVQRNARMPSFQGTKSAMKRITTADASGMVVIVVGTQVIKSSTITALNANA